MSPAASRQLARLVNPMRPQHGSAVCVGAGRDRGVARDPGEDVGGGAAGHVRLGGEQQPVREHRRQQVLQVVRDDVVAAAERGPRLGRAQQLQRGAG